MDKKSDALLRNLLKNWVNRQVPPANGRARLLWEAAQASHNKLEIKANRPHAQLKSISAPYSNEWTQNLFTWINVNSFQYGLPARLT